MGDAPNILLIQSDQHRYDCIGAHGHPLVCTPNLDALAAAGLRFQRAYCPVPVCVPVRNCLMHGQWSGAHGCIANPYTEARHVPSPDLPTLTGCLKEAGYWLGHVGKWHVNHQRPPAEYGFDAHIHESAYADWRAEAGYAERPRTQGYFGESDGEIPASASRLAWSADQLIEMIRDRRAAAQPFFLQWDCSEPHLPNVVPPPYDTLYPPDSVPAWPSFGDPLDGKPYIQRQQLRSWGLEGWPWERWAPIVARYLGEISLLDQQIGRILAALDAAGLAQDTLVIYTTDHGDMCGGHGMIDKHFIFYEDVVHVPLIMRWPTRIAAGQTSTDFVVHALDVARTLCEAACGQAPETFQGVSLFPVMDGTGGTGREDVFSMYHGCQMGMYTQRMVRGPRWKYIWNATAVDELYDLQSDPGEVTNRVADPAAAPVLQRLRRRMLAWMEQTGDPILNGWTRRQLREGAIV